MLGGSIVPGKVVAGGEVFGCGGSIVAGGNLLLPTWSIGAGGGSMVAAVVNCCWEGFTVEGGVYCFWLQEGLLMLAAG